MDSIPLRQASKACLSLPLLAPRPKGGKGHRGRSMTDRQVTVNHSLLLSSELCWGRGGHGHGVPLNTRRPVVCYDAKNKT